MSRTLLLLVSMPPLKRELIDTALEDGERVPVFASQGRLRLAYSESARDILYDILNFSWWNQVLHCRMCAAELSKKFSVRLTATRTVRTAHS